MLHQLSLSMFLTALSAQTQFVLRTPPALAAAFPSQVVAADVDGDGDLDLFGLAGLFASPPLRRLLRNDGAERFTDVTSSWLPPQPAVTSALGRVVTLDADGDGSVDVFWSTGGAVQLWRNNGNGTFVDAGLPPDPGGYNDLAVADLDGDGDLDIAASGESLVGSTNTLFVNQGTTFSRANVLPTTAGSAIATADLDGDGDQDVLLGTASGLQVLRNDGALVFTDVSAQWVGALVPGTIRDIAVGDVDADGDPDVAVCRQSSPGDDVLVNTGGVFSAGPSLPAGPNGSFRLLLVDVDEDGDMDLWRGGSYGIVLALGNGSGGFTPAPSRVPAVSAQTPMLHAADLDGDGDVDLVACEPFTPPRLFVNRQRDLLPNQPVRGAPWPIEVASQPGYATLHHTARLGIALNPLPQPLTAPGFGVLGIDIEGPATFLNDIVFANFGATTFTLLVPNAAALQGLPLHLQALVEQAPASARFTAWHSVVVQ